MFPLSDAPPFYNTLELVERTGGLHEMVRFHAEYWPDREAVIFRDTALTYRELEHRAACLAGFLQNHGLAEGDRIAVLSTPRPEFLITLLAAMKLGLVWVGLNPRYREAELDHILADCAPRALAMLMPEENGAGVIKPEWFPAHHPEISLRLGIGACMGHSFTPLNEAITSGPPGARIPASPRRPAAIVYTSGSTGKPKGALLSQDSFFHSWRALGESFAGHDDLRRHHRTLCALPINHVGCLSDVCGNALIEAGTVVFQDRFSPEDIPGLIEKHKITTLPGVPLMIQAVFDSAEADTRDLSSLKVIAWGGAPMPEALLRRLHARGYYFSMHYGLTEGGSINAVNPPDASLELLTETIGRPDRHNRYRVISSDGAPAAPGETGEVQIRGDGVFLGYYNNPEATARAFTHDGWFKTGDLVELRPDGCWRFVGRSGEMFKSGGYNVYPREIELALEDHPAVATAVVISLPDRKYDEVGWAYVIPAAGHTPRPQDLESYARERLANYKIPKKFLLRAQLPTLPIGKVDKKALTREAQEMLKKEGA